MNFDWLGSLAQNIGNFIRPGTASQSQTLSQFTPNPNYLMNLVNTPKAPDLNLKPQQPQPLQKNIQQGIQNFSPNSPLATMSGQLAQAGQMLPPTVSPYLPTILAMMESGGGVNQAALNNPYGIRGIQDGRQQFINYPDPTTAILGGGGQQGLMGTLLNSGIYNNFLNSGNMGDFFNSWTPQGGGNPSLADLLLRYNSLMGLFPPTQ